jgi:hypothetical protein
MIHVIGLLLNHLGNQPMTKVFITHASTDSWVAKQMAQRVRDCGAATFLDCEQIQHGDDFEQKIIAEALSCTELLVLFTPAAHGRPYVWMEIGMFLGAKKRIVGVLYGTSVQEIASDERMPALLKRIDLANINDLDSYFSQLRTRVKAESEAASQIT